MLWRISHLFAARQAEDLALDAFLCSKKFCDIIPVMDKNVIELDLGMALKFDISIFGK